MRTALRTALLSLLLTAPGTAQIDRDVLFASPKIQEALQQAKPASHKEEAAVIATTAYATTRWPGIQLNVTIHEAGHVFMSKLLGHEVEKYSPFPPILSDRSIKRQELKQNRWQSVDDAVAYLDAEDYSKTTRNLNYGMSALRMAGGGTLGYVELRTPMREIRRRDVALIALTPYLIDVATASLAKESLGGSLLGDVSPYEATSKSLKREYALGMVSASVGAGAFGIAGYGDAANIARAILPPEKHRRMHDKIARKFIAAGIGFGAAYFQIKKLREGKKQTYQRHSGQR